jgi:hypothetical protein
VVEAAEVVEAAAVVEAAEAVGEVVPWKTPQLPPPGYQVHLRFQPLANTEALGLKNSAKRASKAAKNLRQSRSPSELAPWLSAMSTKLIERTAAELKRMEMGMETETEMVMATVMATETETETVMVVTATEMETETVMVVTATEMETETVMVVTATEMATEMEMETETEAANVMAVTAITITTTISTTTETVLTQVARLKRQRPRKKMAETQDLLVEERAWATAVKTGGRLRGFSKQPANLA